MTTTRRPSRTEYHKLDEQYQKALERFNEHPLIKEVRDTYFQEMDSSSALYDMEMNKVNEVLNAINTIIMFQTDARKNLFNTYKERQESIRNKHDANMKSDAVQNVFQEIVTPRLEKMKEEKARMYYGGWTDKEL